MVEMCWSRHLISAMRLKLPLLQVFSQFLATPPAMAQVMADKGTPWDRCKEHPKEVPAAPMPSGQLVVILTPLDRKA